MEINPDIIQNLENSLSTVEKLNTSLKGFSNSRQTFLSSPDPESAKQFFGLDQAINTLYQDSLNSISKLLINIETQMNSNPQTNLSNNQLHQMLDNFYKTPLIPKSGPLPNYAGIFAYNRKKPAPRQFICARIKKNFFLMLIVKGNDKEVYCVDPASTENQVTINTVQNNDWMPLTSIIPEKPNPKYECSKGGHVLSLYLSDDGWTSEFYEAIVILSPSDNNRLNHGRGYTLDFGSDGMTNDIVPNIPEQYVVKFPESWEKSKMSSFD